MTDSPMQVTNSPKQVANTPKQPKETPEQHNWHVLGAGAMGCLWAARLAEAFTLAGQTPDITLILRDNNALSAFAGQVVVESAPDTMTPFNMKATCAAQLSYPITNLLVTTKAFDTAEALRPVLPWLNQDSKICLLQNGIRNHLRLQDMTGIRVLSMTTSHGAWLKRRFHVVHAGSGQTFFGPLQTANPGHSRHSSRSTFPAALAQSMNLKHTEDMEKRLWQKFAANCAINGLTVIHNCQNGELLTRPSAHRELISLCTETERVLRESGHLDMALYPYVREILWTTATNWSSTWQDVNTGRPTEIDEFNGYLCELAARINLPCPQNRAILLSITNQHAVIR